jgi:AcrR family transcriptional regulator
MSRATASRGRRPGAPDTREEILGAARELFAVSGFAATSIRSIAARAGVDPALVHHYFDSKADLFVSALQVRIDPRVALRPVIEAGPDGAGERLLRVLLSVWGDEESRTPLLGLVRGALEPAGATLVRDALFGLVLAPVGVGLGIDQPERRMTLVASQLAGIILLRYVVEAPPMVAMTEEQIVASYAPTLQHYLTGPLPD